MCVWLFLFFYPFLSVLQKVSFDQDMCALFGVMSACFLAASTPVCLEVRRRKRRERKQLFMASGSNLSLRASTTYARLTPGLLTTGLQYFTIILSTPGCPRKKAIAAFFAQL